MKFIQGNSRDQLAIFPTTIEAAISSDNEVRVIEVFVNSLNLGELGFKTDFVENGRPGYHPSDLLKLFIYGYLNRIRSSRALEKECSRNIELMWLLRFLAPDHNTIAVFRKHYSLAIQQVFRSTVSLAKHFELIGGTLLATDGTKLRAQNSKKNNFNEKKIERHIAYIDQKLEEYTKALAAADGDDKPDLEKKIAKQHKHKKQYEQLSEELKQTGEVQLSTSDPESRQLIIRGQITEVAYNVQTTVDAKHSLAIDYEVTNTNDSKAMGKLMERATEIVQNSTFTAVLDKGYHTGSELKIAQQLGITTLVAIPEVASHAPDHAYDIKNFYYDSELDVYRCPEGEMLISNGKWYTKGYRKNSYKVQHYKTEFCQGCLAREKCTKNKAGRLIERSEYTPYTDKNRENIERYPQVYKRRQAIIEHVFGTIKRQWGFCHILTKKGKLRASGDVGLMFTAYNLKRMMNLITKNALLTSLEERVLNFCRILLFRNPIASFYTPAIFDCNFTSLKISMR